MRWGVFHQLQAGGRKRYRLRLVLDDAPEGLTAPKVRAALEAAGYGSRFADAGVAWANHSALPEPKWPGELLAGGDHVTSTSWAALGEAQKGRRLSLVFDPVDFASLELAAAQAGEKLYPWCRRTLLGGATGGG